MQIKKFIGIDVSKNTLDISVVNEEGKTTFYQRVDNNEKSIKTVFSSLMKQDKIQYEDCIFCMEYTGIYNLPLVKWLQTKEANIWMESGSQISKSLGMARGKNDKIDSARIAMYGFSNRHRIKLWQAPRDIINKLSMLLTQRARYIKAKKQLTVPVEEQKQFLDKETIKSIHGHNTKPVAALIKAIESIEKQLLELIKTDENLQRIYKIATSVNGVGMVTAIYMIITTNEFLSITDAKKYACYSGVAPFEHSSGISIRGKNRVSHIANKKVKTVLHLAALAAIKTEGDIKHYYNRKVQEGKNKMSILNAVRNKIIHRVFACVNQNRIFEKNYQYLLV